MKLTGFSFKREAAWILIFIFGLPLLSGLGYLVAWLVRYR